MRLLRPTLALAIAAACTTSAQAPQPAAPLDGSSALFDASVAGDDALFVAPDAAAGPVDAASDLSAPPSPAHKLWIAYASPSTCLPDVEDFFHCLLERTEMNQMAAAYPHGYALSYGGSANVPVSCTHGSNNVDFQCAADNGKFPLHDLDVLLVIYPDSPGGENDGTVMVNVGGHAVHLHGAWAGDSSNRCTMQTAYGMHEVFEAIADSAAADCCDGEIPAVPPGGGTGCLNWCSQCAPSCKKFGPSSCGGDNTYGLATLHCPKKDYTYQTISPAAHEFDGTCLPLTVH